MPADVEMRLQMLALLEDMIRQGSVNWEAGTYIAAASKDIIQDILIPNLVWRAGRVEATIRKVALAGCYGILKAGATPFEALAVVAPTLVPLLVSSLDDTHSDVTPRSMACFCLTIMFDRLKGCFREQSLSEVYHPLLKRLDDSNDSVRIAICSTLVAFFTCAAPSEYRCESNIVVVVVIVVVVPPLRAILATSSSSTWTTCLRRFRVRCFGCSQRAWLRSTLRWY